MPSQMVDFCGLLCLPHWQPCLASCPAILECSFHLGRAHGPPACSVSAPPETMSPVLTALPSSCRSAGRSAPSPRRSLLPKPPFGRRSVKQGPGEEGDSPGPADRCPLACDCQLLRHCPRPGRTLLQFPLSTSRHVLKPKLTGMNVWLPLLPFVPLARAHHTPHRCRPASRTPGSPRHPPSMLPGSRPPSPSRPVHPLPLLPDSRFPR